MAYHHISNGGYSVMVDRFGGLRISQSSEFCDSAMTFSGMYVGNVLSDAFYQTAICSLQNGLMDGWPSCHDAMTTRMIDLVASMPLSDLPPYIEAPEMGCETEGIVLDAVLLNFLVSGQVGHFKATKNEIRCFASAHPDVATYLSNQRAVSFDDRYVVACLSNDPLSSKAATIMAYEFHEMKKMIDKSS